MLFSTEKKWATRPWKDREEPYTYITRWKKLIWKGYTLCCPNYMAYWKGKTNKTIKILVISMTEEDEDE